MNWMELLRLENLTDILDVVLIALLIYAALVWFKKTRTFFVLVGIIIVAGVYLIAREFNLPLTAAILEKFFAVILIAMIVIFQEELRHFFEQIAFWSLHQRGRRGTRHLSDPVIEAVARTIADFARERVGALIVIRGREMILRHLEGGEELNGEPSEALLKSLFDPHSPGHDGAVVIESDRVTKFACYLPLSKDARKLSGFGTRHAAALGLSELTDALCIVVSEERGTIRAAHRGELHLVRGAEELSRLLENFHRETSPIHERGPWADFFKRNNAEKFFALGFALLLWFVLVYGAKPIYKTYRIPIEPVALSPRYSVTAVEPRETEVSFSGPRNAFYFLDRAKVRAILRVSAEAKGRRPVSISFSDVTFPENVVIEKITPSRVLVTLEESTPRTPSGLRK